MLIRTRVVTTFNTHRCHRPFHRRLSPRVGTQFSIQVQLHWSKIHHDAHTICVSKRNLPFKSTLLRLILFRHSSAWRSNFAGTTIQVKCWKPATMVLCPKNREMSQTLTHGTNSQHPHTPIRLAFLHFSCEVWPWPDRCLTRWCCISRWKWKCELHLLACKRRKPPHHLQVHLWMLIIGSSYSNHHLHTHYTRKTRECTCIYIYIYIYTCNII
jgi:hypothetical protein